MKESKQLPSIGYCKFNMLSYLCITLGLSPNLVINVLSDKYIPGGKFILYHPNDIIKSYDISLKLVEIEKDEFNTC